MQKDNFLTQARFQQQKKFPEKVTEVNLQQNSVKYKLDGR